MKNTNVIVVGDCMVDRHYGGPVSRISPEAPCPIVDASDFFEVPGGAANVAMNLSALGCHVDLITVLGGKEDDEGAGLLRNWFQEEEHVKLHALHFQGLKTPIKTRICSSDGQQLIRLDMQNRKPFKDKNVNTAIVKKTEEILSKAVHSGLPSVVVLSDYRKGVLVSDDVLRFILQLADAMKIPTVVDPKSKNLKRYSPCTVLMPNFKEARIACGGRSAEECAKILVKQLHPEVDSVAVTDGSNGMALALMGREKVVSYKIPAQKPSPRCNACGISDVVAALFAINLLCMPDDYDEIKWHIRVAAKRATIGAGAVVDKAGTAMLHSWEYETAQADANMIKPYKMMDIDGAMMILNDARRDGEDIVFVGGDFNQLHAGHVHLLQEAKRTGDVLVVGLRNDLAIRKINGSKYPLVPLIRRANMLEAISCVDLVVPFNESTAEQLVQELKPDLLVVGGEYTNDELSTIPGAEFCVEHGRGIMFVKMLENYGPTALVELLEAPKTD